MALPVVACLGLGYLCGSLPWGLWLGRWFRGVDVRTLGSGNLGATNVYRSLGPPLGIATLLLDAGKGALPVALLPQLTISQAFPGGREWCVLAVAVAVVVGHVWTCFAGFRGGKGVATTFGVLLALAPMACGVFAAVFLVTVLATRYISLGSILASIAFSVTLGVSSKTGPHSPTFIAGSALALLVILRHGDNVKRLFRGTERRFSFRGGSGS